MGAITASVVQVQVKSSLKLVIHSYDIAYIASIHDTVDLSYIYICKILCSIRVIFELVQAFDLAANFVT